MKMALTDYIRRLGATGAKGFEGLIASLLGTLTGRHFYLASSGRQSGRDMASERHGGSVIAVECKRYGDSTELNERELLGELTQARVSIPDLDLWILVTSRDVSDQIYDSLYQAALPFGIEIRTISNGDASPSSFETLLAISRETVIGFLEPVLAQNEKEDLAAKIDAIRSHADFAKSVSLLEEQFSTQSLGYDQWRTQQNKWLLNRFRSADTQGAFGQPINFGASGIKLVERKAARKTLDEWWNNWPKHRQHFALLGEEGDGKTWAVASWIGARILAADQTPPVVFVTSQRASSNDPSELLAKTIANQLVSEGEEFWENRISRWFRRLADEHPVLLLVLDGINERYQQGWWRKLLDQLQDEPWRDRISILITCRANYWKDHFENLRTLPVQTWTLPSFDDSELQTALKGQRLSLKDIREDLLPLIRKPRLFDLVVKLHESMAKSGDITPARLIYEDWRDKWERKSTIPLDPTEFQQLIQELAARSREGLNNIRLSDVSQLLSPLGNVSATLNELCSSGIFKQRGNQFEVDEPRLVLGFGLLLADEIKKASGNTEKVLADVVEKWLEPHKQMDIKTRICGYAAYHALVKQDFPNAARVVLLKAWLRTHTPGQRAEEDFQAYLPLSPEAYIALAEVVWSDTNEHPWVQELIMQAFLRWRDAGSVIPAFRSAFQRWFGFVHPDGYPLQRGPDRKNIENIRTEIASRVGRSLTPGPIKFCGHSLTVVDDDGLLRLGRVALAVISHLPRKAYIHAITTACVADVIMGYPNKGELIGWVLQSSPENLWNEIESEVDALLAHDHVIAKQAAHRLLSYEGGPEANQRKQTLPKDLFPPIVLWENYKKDPCASGFAWRREHCEECVRRKDLSLRFVAHQINKFSIDPKLRVPPEFVDGLRSLVDTIQVDLVWSSFSVTMADHEVDEIEQAMCAFAPQKFADVVRRIFRTCGDREDGALRRISFQLVEHYPIFLAKERGIIQNSWEKLRSKLQGASEPAETAECFFFANVLRAMNSSDQLKHLLERPHNAADLLAFESTFKTSPAWEEVRSGLADVSDAVSIRRVLWFITGHPETIPEDIIEQIKGLIGHDDGGVRTAVLEGLYAAKRTSGMEVVVASAWSWDAGQQDYENHWGSLILCEAGGGIPYRELRSRIHPVYLGYAICQRGRHKNEVRQFAEDLHQIWSRIAGTAPDLPPDFPQSEVLSSPIADVRSVQWIGLSHSQFSRSVNFVSREAFWGGKSQLSRENIEALFNPTASVERERSLIDIAREATREQTEAGNFWFAHQFSTDALDDVIVERPDLVEQWLKPILQEERNATRLLALGRSFYEALVEVLLDRMPEKGVLLYRKLNANTNAMHFLTAGTRIPLIDYALFRSSPVDVVLDAWNGRLKRCKTDRELLEIGILAQEGKAVPWLWSQINRGLKSSVPIDQGRAIMLLAFIDTDEARELLQRRLSPDPQAWVDHVVAEAWSLWQRNGWAKHWFCRFLTIADDTESWAAFRLFLKCVDSRFWIWQKKLKKDNEPDSTNGKRWSFVADNLQNVANNVEKNEESIRERFLGQKILSGQVWPWINLD